MRIRTYFFALCSEYLLFGYYVFLEPLLCETLECLVAPAVPS